MKSSAAEAFFAFFGTANPNVIESALVAPGGSMAPIFQVGETCFMTSAVTQLPSG